VAIIGRFNDDFTFETCEQKTADELPRERLITILTFLLCWFLIIGIPFLVNLGKTLFFVEPIIY
jgi:hypothetical protein